MKVGNSLILILLLFSCKEKPSSSVLPPSLRESVVNEYFARIDSMEYYDTFNTDFKILKAYVNNDTLFLLNLRKNMQVEREIDNFEDHDDSCVVQKRLSALKADKAYRFKHWEAFCPFRQNITITLAGKKVSLNYIEYCNGEGNAYTIVRPGSDTLEISAYCKITKAFDKILTMKEWEELEKRVRDADYWGMKEKGGGGLDGSEWEISAYTHEKLKSYDLKRSYLVRRHNTQNKCFKEIGRYMLKLSGKKTMCGDIN